MTVLFIATSFTPLEGIEEAIMSSYQDRRTAEEVYRTEEANEIGRQMSAARRSWAREYDDLQAWYGDQPSTTVLYGAGEAFLHSCLKVLEMNQLSLAHLNFITGYDTSHETDSTRELANHVRSRTEVEGEDPVRGQAHSSRSTVRTKTVAEVTRLYEAVSLCINLSKVIRTHSKDLEGAYDYWQDIPANPSELSSVAEVHG